MNEIPSRSLSTRHLLGRIILAKMLSMSPKRLEEHVRSVEDLPLFSQLAEKAWRERQGGKMVGLARINLGSLEQRSAANRSTSSHSTAAILRQARCPGLVGCKTETAYRCSFSAWSAARSTATCSYTTATALSPPAMRWMRHVSRASLPKVAGRHPRICRGCSTSYAGLIRATG